jgi:hypothetical protein
MRTRDHVHRHERADLARHFRAGFGGGLHSADVAVDDDGNEAVANFLAAHDGDVGSLDHGIRRSHRGDIALGLDHSDCIAHSVSSVLNARIYLVAVSSIEPMISASMGGIFRETSLPRPIRSR